MNSYDTLCQRVQKIINQPKAQSEKCAEIQRQQDDCPADWARMLEDLGTIENVDMMPLDDDGEHVRVRWNPEAAM